MLDLQHFQEEIYKIERQFRWYEIHLKRTHAEQFAYLHSIVARAYGNTNTSSELGILFFSSDYVVDDPYDEFTHPYPFYEKTDQEERVAWKPRGYQADLASLLIDLMVYMRSHGIPISMKAVAFILSQHREHINNKKQAAFCNTLHHLLVTADEHFNDFDADNHLARVFAYTMIYFEGWHWDLQKVLDIIQAHKAHELEKHLKIRKKIQMKRKAREAKKKEVT